MGAGKSGSIKDQNQSSTTIANGVERRSINIQKIRNVLLVGLYPNSNKDWQQTVAEIRHTIYNMITFSDSDQCIEFIQTINEIKVCVVIFGPVAQQFVTHIHGIAQIDSIYIFSDNKQRDEQLTKIWSKIKGVFTDITLISEALKQTVQQYEQSATPLSFLASTKNLDQLDLSFMYTHLLKEIILTSNFEEKHIKEFVDYCRELFTHSDVELTRVKEFESKYHSQTPIWWYTNNSFLTPMLNRALRNMDPDIITRISFFIADLHRQIEQLHQEQYVNQKSPSAAFTVYLAQGLTKVDFEQLKKSRGGFISFNNFILTNKNSKMTLSSAQDISTKDDSVGIMFIISIDPSQSSTPFASIHDVSCSPHTEDEFLFSMPTMFRINDIKRLTANNRLQEVYLTLVGDKDKDLVVLTNHIRQENSPEKDGWNRLGALLIKMNCLDKAEQVYQFLLDQTKDMNKKAVIYEQLGWIKTIEENYSEAISFYEKSLAIYQKIPTTNQIDLANIYYYIGMAYSKMDNNFRALSSHKEALKIREQLPSHNQQDLAKSYSSIGLLYVSINDYPAALSYFEKELAINQKILPSNHLDLAVTFMDIGMLSYNTGNFPKALSSFEEALKIRQKSLPSNHIDLAELYNNIGLVYNSMNDHPKALIHHEKALAIREKALPQNHADFGASFNNIGVTYENMNNHVKACTFLQRAIENGEKSLPSDDSILQIRKENLERIKKKM